MLQLPPKLTQTTATRCLQDLLAALPAQAGEVGVDAAGLREFDSAALAVLLALRREAKRLKRGFAIAGLPPRLADLAGLYGIAELLPTFVTTPPLK
ncbi:MAG: STAS domain-containing protein [Rhodoferax sp.]|uniref:STAS domain-containing protein n=1 Tax=Rhodoferax sp. TaxID=50421 RepID=UPI001B5DACD9|nr:STAS domain-containing protein [Rhodoferax sp.]MBP9148215.1 STAS domain-containing protein [Rhodoferax sp.]MBP9734772.1 STAS domain-containing protein [Rhodoferax sp.]